MLNKEAHAEIVSSAFVDELTKLGFDERSSYEMLKVAGPFKSYGKAMKSAYLDITQGIKNLKAAKKLKTGRAEKMVNKMSRRKTTNRIIAIKRAKNQIKRGFGNKALIGTLATAGGVGAVATGAGIGASQLRKRQRKEMGL